VRLYLVAAGPWAILKQRRLVVWAGQGIASGASATWNWAGNAVGAAGQVANDGLDAAGQVAAGALGQLGLPAVILAGGMPNWKRVDADAPALWKWLSGASYGYLESELPVYNQLVPPGLNQR
jgi:hypothetical protein